MDVKQIMEEAVANQEVAGMSVLVNQHGKEIFYHQCGYANIEEQKPYTRDQICRMYSMTKPFTGAAIMLLMERGQLALGDQVEHFLPGFANLKVWEDGQLVPARHWLVVKSLLGMTSGLPYNGGDDPASQAVTKLYEDIDCALETEKELTTEEIANRLGQGGLSYQPGENWGYGTSADVLGAIVEKVSGMRFGEFLEENFFAPLGMTDTGFSLPEEKVARLADAYERTPEGLAYLPTRHLGMTYKRTNKPKFESGGAGLVSTIDDYAKFAQMLLNGGSYNGKQILKESTVDYFTKPRMTTLQQNCLWQNWDSLQGYNYGNLMRHCVEPKMCYNLTHKGEYGWDGWLGTFFANDPESDSTLLFTYQLKDAGAYPLNEKLRNAIFYNL